MVAYSQLEKDPRFEGYGTFIQKIMGSLNLSDERVYELMHDVHQQCDHPSVSEIADFIKGADKLMIGGDYDADGVCSTAIAKTLAHHLGVDAVGYYIPNRFDEGYGISINTVDMAHEKGYTHLLLVDNGVKAQLEIKHALSLGMKVAVVDHHLIESKLEVPLLHSHYLDAYFGSMCASGLMYLVAEHVGYLTPKIKAYAALATIADVMPVWGKNREIIKAGLKVLNENAILNIDAISKQTAYDATVLAFKVIPKINSIGRMADQVNMNTMVAYLLSDDAQLIKNYASQIFVIDDVRKKKGQIAKDIAISKMGSGLVDVIVDDSFHEGVLGIVANQVINLTEKPAFILKKSGQVYKGSARSNTISLKSLFDHLNPDYFEAFGGHDFAFGMSIKVSHFENFKRDVEAVVATLKDVSTTSEIVYLEEKLQDVDFKNLNQFEPFGEGFKLPLFAIDKPLDYKMVKLNGFGYKYVFSNYWFKDAVYFNATATPKDLNAAEVLVGSFQFHPRFKLSFQIDMLK